MPGLYVIRSSLISASKPDRSTTSKAAPVPRQEKQRDERSSKTVSRPRRLPVVQISSALQPTQIQTCAQPIRPKQVTDPLTETVRAKLQGTSGPNYSSSGSDHEPSSVCLAAMVHEFLEEEWQVGSCGLARCNCVHGTCSEEGSCPPDDTDDTPVPGGQLCEILEGVTSCTSSRELLLLADVAKAIEAAEENVDAVGKDEVANCIGGCLRRSVMRNLRLAGYNAAVCKSKWDHAGGLPAGDYEYIDVIMDGKNGKRDRFIVDTDFKAQFEIARASSEYIALLQVVPKTFVGRAERLQQILKIMSDAAKRSLKKKGLHLPPWRKQRYMQAKWFSAYKRTTNETQKKSGEALGRGISSIALKGPHFCSEFTQEMELFYHNRSQSREVNKDSTGNGNEIGYHERDTKRAVKRTSEGFFKEMQNKEHIQQSEITVMSTDWQLPAVNAKNVQKGGKVSGLASALREAGLCISSGLEKLHEKHQGILLEQQQQQQQLISVVS